MSSESSLITDYLAVVKLIHVLGGLCIWEVASTCYFELDVLRGKRPYRWTIWVYLFCRIACITTFACLFIEKDMGSGHIDCRGWDTAMYFFSYLTLALASFLILLRIFAIWNRNKWVSLLSISVWLLSIILNIRDLFLAHTVWDSTVQACRPTNTSLILDNMIGILVSDIVLLVTMLVGLWRIRGAGRYGLWRLLYHQGILWLALASIAEVLPVVFVSLNINDAFNLMFQPIELTILSVGATRMYRGLSEYGSFTEYESSGRPVPNRPIDTRLAFKPPVIMITRDTTTGGDWSPIARVPPAKPKAQRDSESDCSTLSAPPSSKPQSPDYFV